LPGTTLEGAQGVHWWEAAVDIADIRMAVMPWVQASEMRARESDGLWILKDPDTTIYKCGGEATVEATAGKGAAHAVTWFIGWKTPHGFSHPSNPLVCEKGDDLKLGVLFRGTSWVSGFRGHV
jgi:hypothetical protein